MKGVWIQWPSLLPNLPLPNSIYSPPTSVDAQTACPHSLFPIPFPPALPTSLHWQASPAPEPCTRPWWHLYRCSSRVQLHTQSKVHLRMPPCSHHLCDTPSASLSAQRLMCLLVLIAGSSWAIQFTSFSSVICTWWQFVHSNFPTPCSLQKFTVTPFVHL